MADGFPIPICKFKRAYFSRIFKGSAAYGYCASKEETYYGFKGNVAINSQGVITGMTVTSTNIDERESLWEIVTNIYGLLFADKGLKGLIGEAYRQQLHYYETGVNLQTPLRRNMDNSRGKNAHGWLVSTRRLVETVIRQLTDHFHIQKVCARDLSHLTHRITRKILAHTLGMFVNKLLGNKPLQFERILTM